MYRKVPILSYSGPPILWGLTKQLGKEHGGHQQEFVVALQTSKRTHFHVQQFHYAPFAIFVIIC